MHQAGTSRHWVVRAKLVRSHSQMGAPARASAALVLLAAHAVRCVSAGSPAGTPRAALTGRSHPQGAFYAPPPAAYGPYLYPAYGPWRLGAWPPGQAAFLQLGMRGEGDEGGSGSVRGRSAPSRRPRGAFSPRPPGRVAVRALLSPRRLGTRGDRPAGHHAGAHAPLARPNGWADHGGDGDGARPHQRPRKAGLRRPIRHGARPRGLAPVQSGSQLTPPLSPPSRAPPSLTATTCRRRRR